MFRSLHPKNSDDINSKYLELCKLFKQKRKYEKYIVGAPKVIQVLEDKIKNAENFNEADDDLRIIDFSKFVKQKKDNFQNRKKINMLSEKKGLAEFTLIQYKRLLPLLNTNIQVFIAGNPELIPNIKKRFEKKKKLDDYSIIKPDDSKKKKSL